MMMSALHNLTINLRLTNPGESTPAPRPFMNGTTLLSEPLIKLLIGKELSTVTDMHR